MSQVWAVVLFFVLTSYHVTSATCKARPQIFVFEESVWNRRDDSNTACPCVNAAAHLYINTCGKTALSLSSSRVFASGVLVVTSTRLTLCCEQLKIKPELLQTPRKRQHRPMSMTEGNQTDEPLDHTAFIGKSTFCAVARGGATPGELAGFVKFQRRDWICGWRRQLALVL